MAQEEVRTIIHITDENLQSGFAQVPRPVLKAKGLSVKAKLVYSLLLDYAWKDDHCFPGQDVLAYDLDISTDSVQRALQELREKKLVDWKQQGLNKPNIYYVLRLSDNPHWAIDNPGNRILRFPETAKTGYQETANSGSNNTQGKYPKKNTLPEIPESTPSNDKNGENSVSQPISNDDFPLAGKGNSANDQPQIAHINHQIPTTVRTADNARNDGDRDGKPVVRHGMEGLGAVLSRLSKADTGVAAIATQPQRKRGRGRPRRPLPEIPPDQYEDLVRLIRDFSRDLGNFDEAESNITQAVNLMAAKRIDFNTFYMYAVEGKRAILSRTKPIKKKMAWWYTWMKNNIPEARDRQSSPSLPN